MLLCYTESLHFSPCEHTGAIVYGSTGLQRFTSGRGLRMEYHYTSLGRSDLLTSLNPWLKEMKCMAAKNVVKYLRTDAS